MKKQNYSEPKIVFETVFSKDILTVSAGGETNSDPLNAMFSEFTFTKS